MAGSIKVAGHIIAEHNIASDTVSIKNATLDSSNRPSILAASYTWNGHNASDESLTITDAPSGGTAVNNDYVSFVNSSGQVTATFAIAGSYFVSISTAVFHSNTYNQDAVYLQLSGGTASTSAVNSTVSIFGPASTNGDVFSSYSFITTPTLNQTLKVLPKYRVSASDKDQHIVYSTMSILYCGS